MQHQTKPDCTCPTCSTLQLLREDMSLSPAELDFVLDTITFGQVKPYTWPQIKSAEFMYRMHNKKSQIRKEP